LYVLGRALQLMAEDFEPATWQACWNSVVLGQTAADVATELGMTVIAVYLAKARVLGRLRRDLAWSLQCTLPTRRGCTDARSMLVFVGGNDYRFA
jgi:ABC-type Fe3+ transport system permease subunit